MADVIHLTPAQVAKRLGLTTRTLETWRDQRRGPAFLEIGPRTIRYTEDDVRAYEESVRQAPAEVRP